MVRDPAVLECNQRDQSSPSDLLGRPPNRQNSNTRSNLCLSESGYFFGFSMALSVAMSRPGYGWGTCKGCNAEPATKYAGRSRN